MADQKISQLPPLTIPSANDLFAIVDISTVTTKKITLSDLMASPGDIGTLNPGLGNFTSIKLPTGPEIDTISNDGDLLNSSTTAVPTEHAVKTYVDSKISEIEQFFRINSDSTALAISTLLVDTGSGDIVVTIIPTQEGRITIKKITQDPNKVIVQSSGSLIDNFSQVEIQTPFESYTFLVNQNEVFIV